MSSREVGQLIEAAVIRSVIGEGKGYSGAKLEKLVLADGSAVVVKRIEPEFDLAMRLTNDSGRAALLFASGVLERLPSSIDHAVIAVEQTDQGWLIAMRDVSPSLIADGRMLTREENRLILGAMCEMHRLFAGEVIPGLCSIADNINLIAPATMAAIRDDPSPMSAMVERGWKLFPGVVPADIASAILSVQERPSGLAERLEACGTTLVHGDLFIENVGLYGERVVMLDWGMATAGPGALDLASYLAWTGARVSATLDEIVDDYRAVCGEFYDEEALHLAFIFGLAQCGWSKALFSTEEGDEAARPAIRRELEWWIARVRQALEVCGPL